MRNSHLLVTSNFLYFFFLQMPSDSKVKGENMYPRIFVRNFMMQT